MKQIESFGSHQLDIYSIKTISAVLQEKRFILMFRRVIPQITYMENGEEKTILFPEFAKSAPQFVVGSVKTLEIEGLIGEQYETIDGLPGYKYEVSAK